MSFLKSIRGTFSSVQKDISKSFKSLKKSEDSNQSGLKVHYLDGDVNFDAGDDLLHKYEESWAEIHNNIEESAKVAKQVDIDISEICVHYERQNEALNDFNSGLSTLPELTKDINGMLSKLETLEQDFITVENMLLILEDVCEQQDLVLNKHKHSGQLEVYRHQKDIEVEQAKAELAKVHAQRVQVHEAKLQECLREKQRALEDAHHYEEEIQKYKLSGETKLKPQGSLSSSDADLANISVDEDNTALEEFLGQTNGEEISNVNKEESECLQEPVPEPLSSASDDSDDNDEFENAKDDTEPVIAITPDEDIKQEDLISTDSNSVQNIENNDKKSDENTQETEQ